METREWLATAAWRAHLPRWHGVNVPAYLVLLSWRRSLRSLCRSRLSLMISRWFWLRSVRSAEQVLLSFVIMLAFIPTAVGARLPAHVAAVALAGATLQWAHAPDATPGLPALTDTRTT